MGGAATPLFSDINLKWRPNTVYELVVGRNLANEIFFEVIQEGLGTLAQGTVNDSTFTSGRIGIYTRSQKANFTNIQFAD